MTTAVEQYREVARWTRFVLDIVFSEDFVPDTPDKKRLVKYANRMTEICDEQFAEFLGLEIAPGLPCLAEITSDLRPCHNLTRAHCDGCTDKAYLTGWGESRVTLYRKDSRRPCMLVVEFEEEPTEFLRAQAKRDAADLGLEAFFTTKVKPATGYNLLPSDEKRSVSSVPCDPRDALVAEAGSIPARCTRSSSSIRSYDHTVRTEHSCVSDALKRCGRPAGTRHRCRERSCSHRKKSPSGWAYRRSGSKR
jgi:hypothetical protein